LQGFKAQTGTGQQISWDGTATSKIASVSGLQLKGTTKSTTIPVGTSTAVVSGTFNFVLPDVDTGSYTYILTATTKAGAKCTYESNSFALTKRAWP
jgi:hypothetical protein